MTSLTQRARSIAIITLAWLILQIGGLFSPGLLDDVDSIYIEVAREMLHRHNFVTPYIDGIRFFDKPPLMYWLAAASMRLFGEVAWAARLPLALAVLALLLSFYVLGRHLYTERAALYATLAFATAVGPYLYTRFFIPDILICLWMTLGVHSFLLALEGDTPKKRLVPTLTFGATLALNLLTKGLIGLVFPIAFVLLYLAITRQFRRVLELPLFSALATFLIIALPWHILAALRNPAIAMPSNLGLPAHAGWAWFYLYNEHIARFLGRRIPHDYGQTPVWLFWLYAVIWMLPWAAFLPALAKLRKSSETKTLVPTLWALIVLIFFTLSSRQEYYSLPALPAVALLIGVALAEPRTTRAVLLCHRWLLLPLSIAIAAVCAWFAITAPHPAPGTDLSSLLAQNPELYNLSLGHLFDLTGAAMGIFRGPLVVVTVGMLTVGLASYALRRRARSHAANLTLAAGAILCLLAAHEGLVRFNPILGSKDLADSILQYQKANPAPQDLILLDGELTSGSTLLFYTRQPVHLVNGRVNGPWFGSFWPDNPQIFEDEQSLRALWHGPQRIFLLTYNPTIRLRELSPLAPATHPIASTGGKTILTNQ